MSRTDETLQALAGRPFWKMTGSGNDFVVLDARQGLPPGTDDSEVIRRICARGTGIGADGVVFLQATPHHGLGIRYFNRDGSLGELCGNASLCTTSLAVRLGLAGAAGFAFQTDAGAIAARIAAGEPEIDLQPARDLQPAAAIPRIPGEERIGFVDTGVPHLVVLVTDAEAVDLSRRGRELRHEPSLAAGANVNFVAPEPDGWRMRTYERGVEGETLACGTGAAAAAILLTAWGLAHPPEVRIRTTSGRVLTVTVRTVRDAIVPSLRGEGRLVYEGIFRDLRA